MTDEMPRDSGPKLSVSKTFGRAFHVLAAAPFFFLVMGALSSSSRLVSLFIQSMGIRQSMVETDAMIILAILLCFANSFMIIGSRDILDGNHFQIRKILALGMRRYWLMLGLAAIFGALVNVGFSLFIVPGLLVGTFLYIAPCFCTLDGLGPIQSIRRSVVFTQDCWLQIFIVYTSIALLPMGVDSLLRRSDFHPFVVLGCRSIVELFIHAIVIVTAVIVYIELTRCLGPARRSSYRPMTGTPISMG